MKTDLNTSLSTRAAPAQDAALRAAAEAYEAAFLAEMLKPMGAASARETFGGGAGEEQFGTFLLQENARAMVRQGGIGLADSIFEALKLQAAEGRTNE